MKGARNPKRSPPLWGRRSVVRIPVRTGATLLPPCDPELHMVGTTIFVTHGIRAWKLETWVRNIAVKSGQRVDWSLAGGRAVVVALGDIEAARATLLALLPQHDKMWRQRAMRGPLGLNRAECDRYLASMREYSGLPTGVTREAATSGEHERSRYVVEVVTARHPSMNSAGDAT